MVFLMGDLDLPLRGRTYREPEGPHVLIVRGADLGDAVDHIRSRADCRALAVLEAPESFPDLAILDGRRFLVAEEDRGRMRAIAEAASDAGAEVEWINSSRPSLDRVAAWALPVGAVVLAAGASSRMGTQKLLLEAGGRPLVRHVVEAAAAGGCLHVFCVYSDSRVREAVEERCVCVHNPDFRSGLSTSLRAGLDALREEMAGAMIMLGDQPLAGARTVALLLRAWRREGARPAAAAAYPSAQEGARPRWLPPVVVDRSLWGELRTLAGDRGARHYLRAHPELLDAVYASGLPDDVDTPDDYAKVVRLFPRRDE